MNFNRFSHPMTQTPPTSMGYGHQVGGTHPTGMHSCFIICFHDKNSHLKGALDEVGFRHKGIMVVFSVEDLLSG